MADLGLYRYPWYYGKIDRAEAEAHLRDRGENEGSFLVRESARSKAWTVAVLGWNESHCTVDHYLVSQTDDNRLFFEEDVEFESLGELVEYYQKNPGRLTFEMRYPCPKEYDQHTDDYGYTVYDPHIELPEQERFIKKTKIYSGSFSESWRGFLASSPTIKLVGKFPINEKDASFALSHEANMMRKLTHENIIRIFGVITRPSFILISYDAGEMSLIEFLLNEGSTELTSARQLTIAKQIASALDYCRRMKCVHRNVKARSVVINKSNMNCKLASLKHCRYHDDYGNYHATREEDTNEKNIGSRIRWMSIEAAKEGRFSTASDAWSYAVFLLELFTSGALPYAGFLTWEVIRKVESGYRCPRPHSCPVELYDMMKKCWSAQESDRPKFRDIRDFLTTYIKDNREILSKLTPPAPTEWNNHYWRPQGLAVSVKQSRTSKTKSPLHLIAKK